MSSDVWSMALRSPIGDRLYACEDMVVVPESTSALIPNCPNDICGGDVVVELKDAEENSPDTVALVELDPTAMRRWIS